MHIAKRKFVLLLVTGFLLSVAIASAQQTKQPFTVADEIGLALFDDPNGGPSEVLFSPDGNYFVVKTETRAVGHQPCRGFCSFLPDPGCSNIFWIIPRRRSRRRFGPSHARARKAASSRGWRWLADSSGIAFLEPTESGNHRLVLADLQKQNGRATDFRNGDGQGFRCP